MSRPIRRSKGTPHLQPDDKDFVCGYCHNTGIAYTRAGKWRKCPCGLPEVKGIGDDQASA